MPSSTRPGDLLADRYRLDDLLSESGGGRFWRAHDRVLRRHVALHVMAADDDRVHLLLDAARRAATVSDARVLRVLDAEQRDDICFVVNEWGYGTSLDIALANNGPLAPRRAAWVVSEVADSLVVAHARGVTHGRLAPENVLIDETGDVRLIGLCVDAALHGLPPGSVRHDLADLGGLLHAALTGRWAGASPSAVTAVPQVQGRSMRPRQVRAGVPRALDDLVDELVNPVPRPAGRPDSPERPGVPGGAPGGSGPDSTAVVELLSDFVGDPSGIARSMALANPLPPPDVVVLPQVPDIVLRVEPPPAPVEATTPTASGPDSPEGPTDSEPNRWTRSDADGHRQQDGQQDGHQDGHQDGRDGPTGRPDIGPGAVPDTFGGRPLFAPAGPEDAARRARAERIGRVGAPDTPREGPRVTDATGTTRPVPRDESPAPRVPGRRWLRLAWLVAVVTLVIVVVSIMVDDAGAPQPADQVVPGRVIGPVTPAGDAS